MARAFQSEITTAELSYCLPQHLGRVSVNDCVSIRPNRDVFLGVICLEWLTVSLIQFLISLASLSEPFL
jgi:hypothetical protein